MIFSATVPKYIQEIAMKKMKNPVLIDLVGTDTTQIPDTISNNIVMTTSPTQKNDQIAKFIAKYPKKKMLIFTETKREAQSFGQKRFAKFAVLSGDVAQSSR